MAWLARDRNGSLGIFEKEPTRRTYIWRTNSLIKINVYDDSFCIELPSDADEKLIGRHISWEDEPVEI